ncbi:MAG: methylated-DNA--[protein]-cysteine S-methyltransferase [Oscillospiraceae bacterium]|nr:methylated-DNA--[protein]-cysteine S-methyltransferase [Oscillospiraceae bacterium]
MLYCYVYTFGSIEAVSLTADENRLLYIDFGITARGNVQETALLKEVAAQLGAYFKGERKRFDFPFYAQGTQFQQKVWAQLQTIPYGETASYKQIAVAVKNEKACRAVGMANNKNPLPIVIPCHRIIGANGSMVGYAGGLFIKTELLKLERRRKDT